LTNPQLYAINYQVKKMKNPIVKIGIWHKSLQAECAFFILSGAENFSPVRELIGSAPFLF